MEGFIDLLDTMCSAFRPYIEAVRQNRDETLKAELRRMEQEKEAQQKREREQREMLEEGYKEELQRRQLQDALNKQTYQQFKVNFLQRLVIDFLIPRTSAAHSSGYVCASISNLLVNPIGIASLVGMVLSDFFFLCWKMFLTKKFGQQL